MVTSTPVDISRHGQSVLDHLKELANPANVRGMARYGIAPANCLGIPMKALRLIARDVEPDHELAKWLWKSGIHEARLLATIIDEPERVTRSQMDRWVRVVDSWDLCDQCCANLFEKTPYAWSKCIEWSRSKHEFVKRAGFSLMARLAVSDKAAADASFLRLLSHIRRGADDERNFVKKSVNWALRQIGKRNMELKGHVLRLSRSLLRSKRASARWVGRDALAELTRPEIRARIHRKRSRSPSA